MSKGKKFNAAEKHFEKKRLQYENEIKYLKNELDTARKQSKHYQDLYEFDERNIEELNKLVDWLLKHAGLSKEEVKDACKKDIEICKAFEWLNNLSGIFRYDKKEEE